MIEEWKDIEEYKGLYQISNLGRVRSLQRITLRNNKYPFLQKEKIKRNTIRKNEYLVVTLYKNGVRKTHLVHRLVALAFVKNLDPVKFTDVNHIDGNPSNPVYTNLEWCDKFMNMQHARDTGLLDKKDHRGGKNPKAKKVKVIYPDGNISIFNTCKETASYLNIHYWIVLKYLRNKELYNNYKFENEE